MEKLEEGPRPRNQNWKIPIHADFSACFTRVKEYWRKREEHWKKVEAGEGADFSFGPYIHGLENIRERDGILWFDDQRELSWGSPESKFAQPQDYAKIRDDTQALKDLVIRTLAIGSFEAGNSRDSSETLVEPHAYISWLFKASDYQPFKNALAQICIELTLEQLRKTFTTRNVEAARLEIEKNLAANFPEAWIQKETLNGALWRVGLDRNLSPEDIEVRERFVEGLKKTERPITLEEVLNQYAGTKDELRSSFAAGNFKDELRIHAAELPDQLKAEVRDWKITKGSVFEAERKNSPQYNTLLGLLRIIAEVGSNDNEFKILAGPLESKLRNGFLEDVTYRSWAYSSDPYVALAHALSAVQTKGVMSSTWLEILERTKEPLRAYNIFKCGLESCETDLEREQFIISGLGKTKDSLTQANFTFSTSMGGFIQDQDIGDGLGALISQVVTSVCP